MDQQELTRRLDRLESESAIRHLAAEYCHGADKRDATRFSSVWHSNAVWDVRGGDTYRGRAAIVEAVQSQWAAFDRTVHLTTNHVLTIDGDAASGESDVDVAIVPSSGDLIRAYGTYRDTYRREDGRWWITRRDAEVLIKWNERVATERVRHEHPTVSE